MDHPIPAAAEPLDDDLDFQPRSPRRLHWFTVVLLVLAIWGSGFLVGVLVDRAMSGFVG